MVGLASDRKDAWHAELARWIIARRQQAKKRGDSKETEAAIPALSTNAGLGASLTRSFALLMYAFASHPPTPKVIIAAMSACYVQPRCFDSRRGRGDGAGLPISLPSGKLGVHAPPARDWRSSFDRGGLAILLRLLLHHLPVGRRRGQRGHLRVHFAHASYTRARIQKPPSVLRDAPNQATKTTQSIKRKNGEGAAFLPQRLRGWGLCCRQGNSRGWG
jgi:hypothetical protein